MTSTVFRQWVAPLVSPREGKWGSTFNDLTPEQKQTYRELKHYYDKYADSEYPDALAYLNRNKLTYKIAHLFGKKGGNN